MLNKVLIQTQFGAPHSWTEQYLDHFQKLSSAGWKLLVFTPNDLKSRGNVEIIPMTLGQFDGLVEKYCGVDPRNYLVGPAPRKVISDFYCAHGAIFQDYLKDADYWGFSNWDCVYGRLSKFLPDSELVQYQVWSDDASPAINGILSLFQNDPTVNRLFEFVPNWREHFLNPDPCAFDEILMTDAMRKLQALGLVEWGYPEYFPFHSYDRLVMHQPKPNVYFDGDALIERLEDPGICPPTTLKHYGREIMYLHFSRTKPVWPIAA